MDSVSRRATMYADKYVSHGNTGSDGQGDLAMKIHRAMLATMVAMAAALCGCTLFDFGDEPEEVTYNTIVTCEVRLVSVADGAIVATASSHEELADLDDLADDLADDLEGGKTKKGQAVTVATLRNRSGTDQCKRIGDELLQKIEGELVSQGYFAVHERLELRAILDEKDLESSSVVKNPKVRKKLAGVDYLLLGGVSIRKEKD